MIRALCRAVIRVAAVLAPRALRARWREEWLGEIDAVARTRGRDAAIRLALGAPLDAVLARWTTADVPVRHGWRADARDATRALLKTPMQTATMIGCLAVGAALMVTMYAITHALFGTGRLPGVDDRERVALLYASSGPGRTHTLGMGQYLAADWTRLPPAIEKFGAELGWKFLVRVNGVNQESKGAFVNGDFFGVFGAVPAAGRLIGPLDDRAGAQPAVVISYGFWKRHFNGDHSVIGAPLQIGTETLLIAGVAPEGFMGTRVAGLGQNPEDRFDVWLPMSLTATWTGFPRQEQMTGPPVRPGALSPNAGVRISAGGFYSMAGPVLVARLAPGVTREAAEPQLQHLVPQITEGGPRAATRHIALRPFMVMPIDDDEFVFAYASLFMVPLMVLIIGCANVAGLQGARSAWRSHELSVRTSLGASRGRLARLLMIEVFITATAAAFAAWALSTWALRYTETVLPFHAHADWRVFVFALGLPLLITFLIGLLPSWRAAGVDVVSGIKNGSQDGQQGQWRFRRFAVITQIGLSVVLVFGAVMLTRAVGAALTGAPATQSNVVVAGFYFNDIGLTPGAQRAAAQSLIQHARDLAGPGDVALSTTAWPRGGMATLGAPQPGFHPNAWLGARVATPELFDLLNLRIIAGRVYRPGEHDVMLVNEAFARRHSSLERVVGETFDIHADTGAQAATVRRRIIGVVQDERAALPAQAPEPSVYLPLDLAALRAVTVFMRSSNPILVKEQLREAATGVYATLAPRPLATIGELQSTQFRSVRWLAQALTAVGALALLLAAVGLFAMVSASVSQRTREFGVRLALGADPAGIIALVLREVGRLAAAGLAAGIVLSVPVMFLLRTAFVRTATLADPSGLVLGLATMTMAVIAAAWLPARRAARVDPLTALRAE